MALRARPRKAQLATWGLATTLQPRRVWLRSDILEILDWKLLRWFDFRFPWLKSHNCGVITCWYISWHWRTKKTNLQFIADLVCCGPHYFRFHSQNPPLLTLKLALEPQHTHTHTYTNTHTHIGKPSTKKSQSWDIAQPLLTPPVELGTPIW